MKAILSLCVSALVGSTLAAPRTSCRQVNSMSSTITSSSYASATSGNTATSTSPSSTAAPTVDLGYEIHQATINETGNYYLFSNIPYARQPVGSLRFKEPIAPTGSSSVINNGSATTEPMCVQAYPGWIIAEEAEAYGVDTTTMAAILYEAAGQTESCLLLDVYVPADVYNNGLTAEAPVLFWIHGGGFTFGSKTSVGNPSGLVARSELNGGSPAIVVSINYRLGLYGWLVGAGITPNLGLYDQRLAMEWVQKYIGRFGGNAADITVMGESAGASSILHHITSYGGAKAVPFKKAIVQSPAFEFNINYQNAFNLTVEAAVNEVETLIANSSSLQSTVTAALAGVSLGDANFTALATVFEAVEDTVSDAWKAVNQAVVYQASSGRFNYGVMVDGTYVPKLPQVLLAEGSFDTSINVMTSHTSNESITFDPTDITTAEDVTAYVLRAIPAMSNATADYFLNTLYPDVLDGTYPWWSEFGRVAQMATELDFACSTNYLAKAYGNETHNYIFGYPPGYHAEDLAYIFFNGGTSSLNDGYAVNETLAHQLQDYLVQFAKTGDPNVAGLPTFPRYSSDGLVLDLTAAGPSVKVDDMKNDRCAWIQQALVDGLLT